MDSIKKYDCDISARECILLKMIKKDLEEDYSRIIVCSNSNQKSEQFYFYCKDNIENKNIQLMLMRKQATCVEKDRATKLLRENNRCIIFQVKVFNLGVNIPEITTSCIIR